MMPEMARCVGALVAAARQAQVLVIWVRATYDEIVQGAPLAEILSRDGGSPVRCAEGSWGADWFGALRPADSASELVVTKHRYSAFWDTEIDLLLRVNGITSVVVCGTITSGCVESTARDAYFLNYRVVLPGDACASYARARHDNALAKLALTFGVVVGAEEITATWHGADAAGARGWQMASKQALVPKGAAELLAPDHTALVIIDMQNDFCHPDGVMGRNGEGLAHNRGIIAVIASLLAAARAAGVLVVHVNGQYGPASGSAASLFRGGLPTVSQVICLPGSWGAAQIDDLAILPGEPVVVKHRLSAFRDTGLELLLRSNFIRTIVAVGTATQACVESTVREAHLRDYHVVVPPDAVAARDRMQEMHLASLTVMADYFATLMPSAGIVDVWRS
jgi:nicotinamidase-related amidase